MTTGEHLAGVVRQRSKLSEAMQQVELAAAAPAAKDSWMVELTHSLRQLEISFNQHIVDVSSPLGLLDQIVDEAPRLQRAVAASREEHNAVAELIRDAIAKVSDASATPEIAREAAMGAMLALARHRQKGADLIYDAYDVDIGGY